MTTGWTLFLTPGTQKLSQYDENDLVPTGEYAFGEPVMRRRTKDDDEPENA